VFAGSAKDAEPSTDGWEWSLSVGPAFRDIGTLKTDAGYRSGSVIVPSFVGNGSLDLPSVGDEAAYGDRAYNDGYVRQDAGTQLDGATWHWGYDNDSQVQGNQLVFSATGYQSTLRDAYTAPFSGPSSRDSLRGLAPRIQFDARGPQRIAEFRLGFSGGFDFTRADHNMSFSNFSGSQFRDDYRLDYEDRYELNGIIPPLAPYMGNIGGPGPIIDNIPSNRTIRQVLLFTDAASISNQVKSSFDLNVLSLTFGPTLTRTWGAFDLSIQSGLILNLYDWDASQSERLNVTNSDGTSTVARWAEGSSGTKLRPGIYAQVDVSYDIDEDVLIGAFMRLDTAREFRASAGPTTFRIDPSGIMGGLMIRFRIP
jgi:hypothetical protein